VDSLLRTAKDELPLLVEVWNECSFCGSDMAKLRCSGATTKSIAHLSVKKTTGVNIEPLVADDMAVTSWLGDNNIEDV